MRRRFNPLAEGLLTQNEDLAQANIWGWTLPAHIVDMGDGRKFNTCPSAGVCAAFCYAKSGRWMFPAVKAAHTRKLRMVLDDLTGWEQRMVRELRKPKYDRAFVRVHDGGDFFSAAYARAWFRIARQHPHKLFYSYTKEVKLFKDTLQPHPSNFVVIYSLGGRQDKYVDKSVDRHSEVFPSLEALEAAGYFHVGADDSVAATNPNHRVGLLANNIPHLRKKQGDVTFGEWQVSKGKHRKAP